MPEYRVADWTPAGVAKVSSVEDAGPVIRLDSHDLPDLDELTMWLATIDSYGDWDPWWLDRYGDNGGRAEDYRDDPTCITWCRGELPIAWHRMTPCYCGPIGERPHGWHIDQAYLTEDGEPRHRRGAFLAVWSW